MLKTKVLNIAPQFCFKSSDSVGTEKLLLSSSVPYYSLLTGDNTGTIQIPIELPVQYKQDNVDRGINIKSFELTYGIATAALDAALTATLYKVNTDSTTIAATALATETNTFSNTASTFQEKLNLSVVGDHVYNENSRFYIQLDYNGAATSELKIYNTQVIYDELED